jgi:hypothetical protein
MSAPLPHRRTTYRDRLRDALFVLVGAVLICAIALVSNDRARQVSELSPPLRSADEPSTTHTQTALALPVVPMTDEESRESAQRAALAAANAADEAARAANNSDPR